MSESPEEVQKRILDRSQSAEQTQITSYEKLKRQGQSLKINKKDINELSKERKSADKDLSHIKKNKNVFKRFLLDYCCCFCCQCCKDCCEDKTTEPVVMAATTESEEPDPDDDTINKSWTQRYEPKTLYEQLDDKLKRLKEGADDYNRELNKQNKSIEKNDKKAKDEIKALQKSTQTMKEIRK